MNQDTQQRICTSRPFCLCVGHVNDWDECCCTGGVRGCSTERCEACGAAFIVIDFATGETVEVAV